MINKRPKIWRRIKTFRTVSKIDRRNPSSIRRFLFDLIDRDFDRSCTIAAEAISDTLSKTHQTRKHRRRFSGEATYKVSRDIQTISYNQIDGMALHYKVPMALILLFTRLRSEIENDEGHSKHGALRVLRSFRASIDACEIMMNAAPNFIEDVYESFGHDKFLELRDAYLAAFEEAEPLLPLR